MNTNNTESSIEKSLIDAERELLDSLRRSRREVETHFSELNEMRELRNSLITFQDKLNNHFINMNAHVSSYLKGRGNWYDFSFALSEAIEEVSEGISAANCCLWQSYLWMDKFFGDEENFFQDHWEKIPEGKVFNKMD